MAEALAEAKLVTIASNGGAPESTVQQIGNVIQTVLAAQLVGKAGLLDAAPIIAPVSPVAVPPATRPGDGAKRN